MMMNEWAERSMPWQGLTKDQYVVMKNAFLDYWRKVIPRKSQRAVFKEIVRWQNYETGASFRSHHTIAAAIHLSSKTVQRAVRDLERAGLVTVERLADAPRTSEGMLTFPRIGGRANHYWFDYNAVRTLIPDGRGWEAVSDPVGGALAQALAQAHRSDSAEPQPSPQCPANEKNVLNGVNAMNAATTTSMVAGGRALTTKAKPPRSRLAITAETTAEELNSAYPDWRDPHPAQDWSLRSASVLAGWAIRHSLSSVPVDVERVAERLWQDEGRVGRTAVFDAFQSWVRDREDDYSMVNPGALLLKDLSSYLDAALADLATSADQPAESETS